MIYSPKIFDGELQHKGHNQRVDLIKHIEMLKEIGLSSFKTSIQWTRLIKNLETWTPIDCWSWNNAYKNRYGFISLDLEI